MKENGCHSGEKTMQHLQYLPGVFLLLLLLESSSDSKQWNLRHGTGFAISLKQCSRSPRLATESEETAVSSPLG